MTTPLKYAMYVPVGPSKSDVDAVRDLLDSVFTYSTGARWCVLVDDSLEERRIIDGLQVPSYCEVITLNNPRRGKGPGKTGGLCAAVLAALDHIHRFTAADFVLKLDTDALVISDFDEKLAAAFNLCPGAGLLGVVGDSFGPNRTYNGAEYLKTELFDPLMMTKSSCTANLADAPKKVSRWSDDGNLESLVLLRSLVELAQTHGYQLGEYCQGGSYVVTKAMIEALAASGYLRDPLTFVNLRVGEDVLMSVLCRAMGLLIYDLSSVDRIFAVQYTCLPFSCEELAASRHSIIHSIRGSAEDAVRQYFRDRRSL
jgi:hypothetical protein